MYRISIYHETNKTVLVKWIPSHHIHMFLILLINLTETSGTPSVRWNFASVTRSRHCCFVSVARKRGSTLKSRSSNVKKQTASTLANLRPTQARGPMQHKNVYSEKLEEWLRHWETYRYQRLRKLRRWKYDTNEKAYISQVRRNIEGYILYSQSNSNASRDNMEETYGCRPCQLRPTDVANIVKYFQKNPLTSHLDPFWHRNYGSSYLSMGLWNLQYCIFSSLADQEASRSYQLRNK